MGISGLLSHTSNNTNFSFQLIVNNQDMKGLTGKVQEQAKEKVKEAVKGLLEGTTKPNDLKQEGQELMKDLLGR